MSHTKFELRSTRTLQPDPGNARLHSKKQQARVTAIIKQVGFINPIVVNSKAKILAGHARYMAAKSLGLNTVPVIVVNGLTAAEEQAYVLADNRIPEGAAWDRSLLANHLNNLAPLLAEEGLSIELTGFEAAEIDGLMGDLVDPERDPADELPQIANKPVSKVGDLWQLGEHRLFCGDSCEEPAVRALMDRDQAAMIFADPLSTSGSKPLLAAAKSNIGNSPSHPARCQPSSSSSFSKNGCDSPHSFRKKARSTSSVWIGVISGKLSLPARTSIPNSKILSSG
jgi:hypothetical protein